ncbi:thioredoxin [Nonomuraea sp. NPDC000554]|uniref:thioredoxin n=1 Tax=Nonomuraea sp. NPDC000554 TaxID=3154259 RepID=UPI0033226412
MSSSTVSCPNCGKKNRVPAASGGVPRCGSCHQPLPWIVEAADDTFAEVAERSDLPVVVDFWAAWCGPCQMVTPVLEQLAREMAGRVKLVKVDVDRSTAVAERYAVQHIPMLVLLDGGQVVAQRAGAAPAPELRAWIEEKVKVGR